MRVSDIQTTNNSSMVRKNNPKPVFDGYNLFMMHSQKQDLFIPSFKGKYISDKEKLKLEKQLETIKAQVVKIIETHNDNTPYMSIEEEIDEKTHSKTIKKKYKDGVEKTTYEPEGFIKASYVFTKRNVKTRIIHHEGDNLIVQIRCLDMSEANYNALKPLQQDYYIYLNPKGNDIESLNEFFLGKGSRNIKFNASGKVVKVI